ncbi:uncharacterized protein LOC143510968 [Brachyhypopomus gauderio]|uniref:uncharacterized protein LOC143510968 n=1 Tax=Brachyhypopomus gauderio TaxID=698409 RepID=UPI0040435BC8
MAGEGRTVRVSGLPVDIPENRLLDKICIHFLRRKNGGGEITSVSICKTTPGTAFITFEDRQVALRLVQQGKQVFRVGDKNYDVTLSLNHEPVDVDSVVLHMSVTVDHSKLPKGKMDLLALQRDFPGVHMSFDSHRDVCSLGGCYSDVQALITLLLTSCQSQIPGDTPQSQTKGREKGDIPLDMPANSAPLETDEPLTKQALQRAEELDVELHTTSWKSGLDQQDRYSHPQLPEASPEDERNLEPESVACLEDFSFVVDSDIYRYLHKYCSRDYQNILRRHRVEVLDETCQDITTLYLKPKKGLSGRSMGPVKRAQQDLAQLYQHKGSQLRKEQVSKSGIPQKGLQQALETLRQSLPQLMVEEDEGNINLVGSGSDVSEGKQFITDMKGTMRNREACSENLLDHSQSNFPFSKQTPSELPAQSDIFQPLGNKFQDDLFISRKDYQKASKYDHHHSNEGRLNYGELTDCNLFTQKSQGRVMNDDIFSVRREDNLVERHVLTDKNKTEPSGWGNTEKITDVLSVFPKPSLMWSTSDLDRRSVDNPELCSEETQFKVTPDTNLDGIDKQVKSAKGRKAKRTESGRDLKMAANFSHDMCTGNVADTRNSEDPKLVPKLEGGLVYERPLDGGQTRSLPFIKPSMNSKLIPMKSNLIPNSTHDLGSGLTKVDVLLPKSDLNHGLFHSSCPERKPVMTPAHSTECPPFSLGHMDLCGDAGIKHSPAVASGSALKRSNSFSGRIRRGRDEQMMVDLSARPQGNGQGEIFTVDVPISIKVWLYLKSLYSNEIDNLTSDLQLKEDIGKDEFALCLRGADLEKLKECQRGLRGLIATVELDFCAQTLPLSVFGVSDSKDKTLLDVCARLKQNYERVKVLLMSKTVMILGPRLMCEEVEAAMKNAFYTGVGCAKTGSGKTHKHSPLPISTDHDTLNNNSEPLTEYSTLTTENVQVPIMKNLDKTDQRKSDQRNACISKQVSADQTRDTKLTTADSRDQGEQDHFARDQDDSRNWNMVDKKKEERTEVEPTQKLRIGEGETNKDIMKTGSFVITARRSVEDDKINEEHRMIPVLHARTEMEAYPLSREPFTEGVDPGSSVSQAGNDLTSHGGPDLGLSTEMTSHVGGNEGIPSSKWQEETHPSCNQTPVRRPLDAHQGTLGIRGTMSIRETTITIPGFIRDTTLRIIYDIPDGIQGEDNPCPGAPFKGNRFEAFLPLNEVTKKLLPLLKKAFNKGLTFTIKAELPGGQGQDGVREARVVWGSIPHKTNIDGGTSKNGYPDSTYIRRLTQTLQTAGLEE